MIGHHHMEDGSKQCPPAADKGEGSSKRNGTYGGAKGGNRGGAGASSGRKGSPEGSQGRGYSGAGKKALLRNRDEELRDPDFRREYMQCAPVPVLYVLVPLPVSGKLVWLSAGYVSP